MITIVGVGALGSHVALFLRNEKTNIRLVDMDRVEMKNTQAQFHTVMSLGKNKAQALQQSLKGLFKIDVGASPHRLTEDNTKEILKGSSLVIDCTDNIQARKVIASYCKEVKVELLHGALSASGDFARVVWEENFKPDAETGDGATCENGDNLPFIAFASTIIAIEVQNFLKTKKKRSWQLTPAGVLRLA